LSRCWPAYYVVVGKIRGAAVARVLIGHVARFLGSHVDEGGRGRVIDWPSGAGDGHREGDSKSEESHDCFEMVPLVEAQRWIVDVQGNEGDLEFYTVEGRWARQILSASHREGENVGRCSDSICVTKRSRNSTSGHYAEAKQAEDMRETESNGDVYCILE
jgi:hypothetical protein